MKDLPDSFVRLVPQKTVETVQDFTTAINLVYGSLFLLGTGESYEDNHDRFLYLIKKTRRAARQFEGMLEEKKRYEDTKRKQGLEELVSALTALGVTVDEVVKEANITGADTGD
jgi:hypothetical protein